MPAADRVEAFTVVRKHWRLEFDIIFQANRKWFTAVLQSSPAGKCCYLNNIYTSNYSFFLLSVLLWVRLFLFSPYSYFGYARPLSCQRHAASHLYRYIDSHWGVAGGSCTLLSAAVQLCQNNRYLCKHCRRTARSHLTQISMCWSSVTALNSWTKLSTFHRRTVKKDPKGGFSKANQVWSCCKSNASPCVQPKAVSSMPSCALPWCFSRSLFYCSQSLLMAATFTTSTIKHLIIIISFYTLMYVHKLYYIYFVSLFVIAFPLTVSTHTICNCKYAVQE